MVKPQIAPSMFPAPKSPDPDTPQQPNTSRRRAETAKPTRKPSTTSEDFGDDGLDDDELLRAGVGDLEFQHIDNFANPTDAITRKNTAKNKPAKGKTQTMPINAVTEDGTKEPIQLANGKWACNHRCKDRDACKHLCCKEGTDKRPKKTAAKLAASGENRTQPSEIVSTQKLRETQTKLHLSATKRKTSSPIEELDLTQQEKKKKCNYAANGPRDYRELHQLHKSIQKNDPPSTLHSVMHKKPAYCYSQGGEHTLSFMDQYRAKRPETASDYGDISADELSSHLENMQQPATVRVLVPLSDRPDQNYYDDYPATALATSRGSDTFGDDDSLLGDAMIGLADSQNLQEMGNSNDDIMGPLEDALNNEYGTGFQDDDFPLDIDFTMDHNNDWDGPEEPRTATPSPTHKSLVQKSHAPIFNSISSPKSQHNSFKPVKTIFEIPELRELKQHNTAPLSSRQEPSDKALADDDINVLDLLDNMFDDPPVKKEKPVPAAFKDLEPWLFQEFGDIVELVDE
jgi:ATP-dependent DNA helicase HFM1/MER3